ncbi:hypothetical protein CEXT_532341 [Caerostris extrusa]|uniref:Uncharacterized protein n=1 Tax=Caerostris extrusa TaxID=172846 RepID=A0AAV4STV8_CAEEX|nr:hypothetical protein CEXT_532341 [Caerostris extrusa]
MSIRLSLMFRQSRCPVFRSDARRVFNFVQLNPSQVQSPAGVDAPPHTAASRHTGRTLWAMISRTFAFPHQGDLPTPVQFMRFNSLRSDSILGSTPPHHLHSFTFIIVNVSDKHIEKELDDFLSF